MPPYVVLFQKVIREMKEEIHVSVMSLFCLNKCSTV